MKTYTVPVFLGVVALDKDEAQQLALRFIEYALDVSNADVATFPYSYIGNKDEIVEQLETQDDPLK